MYNNITDYYQGFYHGPIVSKIWLLEKLEKIIEDKNLKRPNIHILGCWQNILAFMMQVRKPNFYEYINGYDLDNLAILVSDKICDAWKYENSKVHNYIQNVYELQFEYDSKSIFINCSADQFKDNTWYDKIPTHSLVAIQATDIVDDSQNWEITQKFYNLSDLINKFPMQKILFSGIKKIEYDTFSYNRLMAIGIK